MPFNIQIKTEKDTTTDFNEEIFGDWGFPLSIFQKHAITALYNNNNALITAFTGSGKTLPAEWGIKHYTSLGNRVVYTSPIKALSNEKYFDLSSKFPNISFGLITGDTEYNKNAQVLIMTTEIFRNNLFKKLAMEEDTEKNILLDFELDIKDLALVVFDEIHWINDKHRGGVWDETIMTLNDKFEWVQMLGLSATVDNPKKLCKRLSKNRDVWLCPNNKRVVPLEHFTFITAPDSTVKKMKLKEKDTVEEVFEKFVSIKSPEGKFDEETYHKLKKVLPIIANKNSWIKPQFVIERVLTKLKENDNLPALLYVFSRKKCNEIAKQISIGLFEEDSKTPAIIRKEANAILRKMPNFKELTVLPEYEEIMRLNEKGIAVHHSGISKPFREMQEILFKKGYYKLLVATETMGVGVDMPVRTVIYMSLLKFDGNTFRYVHPHEYAQQAGRAGRRGRDTKGRVIHLLNLYDSRNNMPTVGEMRHILTGGPAPMKAKFNIDFNLVLRLLNAGYTKEQMIQFIKNSMLNDELEMERQGIVEQIVKCHEECDKYKNNLKYLRTKTEVLENYKKLKKDYEAANKKKKKKIEREISHIEIGNKFLKEDFVKFQKPDELQVEIKKLEQQNENVIHYIENEVQQYIDILKNESFVENLDDTLTILEKGRLAVNLQECHSLAIAEFIHDYKDLVDKLEPKDFAVLFSVFTNIRVAETERKRLNNLDITENSHNSIRKINSLLDKYYDIETRYQTSFTSEYQIQYDLCEIIQDWVNAENEEQCKQIYSRILSNDIFIEEFIKAILKINSIVKEFEKVCLEENHLALASKIKEIPQLLVKSVVNDQSLYLQLS